MRSQATVVLLFVAAIAVDCTQARSIKQLGWGGDGREAYINSRIFNMRPSRGSPTSRNALTDEAAETSANSQPGGIHRLFAPRSRRTYATVNPDNIEWNTLKAGVQTRARSAQDLPRSGPNRSNGNPNMPSMVIGGVAFAQTYEGAISTSTTDSIPLNRGGSGTSFSANMVTSRQSPLRRVARGQSWGVTAQPVGSGALVGATNGHVAMAQADSAVAYSHGEQSTRERNWVQGGAG